MAGGPRGMNKVEGEKMRKLNLLIRQYCKTGSGVRPSWIYETMIDVVEVFRRARQRRNHEVSDTDYIYVSHWHSYLALQIGTSALHQFMLAVANALRPRGGFVFPRRALPKDTVFLA